MRVLERKCTGIIRSIEVDNEFIKRVAKIEALMTLIRPDLHVGDISVVETTLMEVDAFIETLNDVIDGKNRLTDDVDVDIVEL